MIRINREQSVRVCQGDIFEEIHFIENVVETNGEIEISRVTFPWIIVLTQDCDLQQDYFLRNPSEERTTTPNQDKQLFSILVAPLYNAEHVYQGTHLSALNMEMSAINKKRSQGNSLRNNEIPRYHYLQFPPGEVQIPDSVIDFKHYFSVNRDYLESEKNDKFICKVNELFREDISHRFAAFLSRIGLPS